MSTTSHSSHSSASTTTPIRISRGSRPGWGQTAVRFRVEVTTTTFASSAPQAASPAEQALPAGCEQLTLFDTAPYAKGVK
jgi:hypothetical protein